MTTTSSSICLFHDRRYSSNVQCILNLLRKNLIKIKCDLNLIGKKCLCICKLSSNQMLITDEEFVTKQKEFNKLKINQYFKEINRIIQLKVVNTCDSQISIYKLLKLICDISNEQTFLRLIKSSKSNKIKNQYSRNSNLIRCRITLSLSSNQIGHLLGRDGHLHKKIMNNTNTRIHFDNAPYAIDISVDQGPEFDLDLFQSSNSIQATITGHTTESVENAIKALEKLDRSTQVNLSRLYKK